MSLEPAHMKILMAVVIIVTVVVQKINLTDLLVMRRTAQYIGKDSPLSGSVTIDEGACVTSMRCITDEAGRHFRLKCFQMDVIKVTWCDRRGNRIIIRSNKVCRVVFLQVVNSRISLRSIEKTTRSAGGARRRNRGSGRSAGACSGICRSTSTGRRASR